jgi:hypothetical protein
LNFRTFEFELINKSEGELTRNTVPLGQPWSGLTKRAGYPRAGGPTAETGEGSRGGRLVAHWAAAARPLLVGQGGDRRRGEAVSGHRKVGSSPRVAVRGGTVEAEELTGASSVEWWGSWI